MLTYITRRKKSICCIIVMGVLLIISFICGGLAKSYKDKLYEKPLVSDGSYAAGEEPFADSLNILGEKYYYFHYVEGIVKPCKGSLKKVKKNVFIVETGEMKNDILIIYEEELLLVKPTSETITFKKVLDEPVTGIET